MARMNPRQSEKAFLEAIEEFQAIVRTGRDRALGTSKSPAGAPASSAPATQQTAAPAAGEGFVVGRAYIDGFGRTGKYLGQNPDGTPKFELVQ
jgi:glutamate dehydrogenase/leucine dehydrogenase